MNDKMNDKIEDAEIDSKMYRSCVIMLHQQYGNVYKISIQSYASKWHKDNVQDTYLSEVKDKEKEFQFAQSYIDDMLDNMNHTDFLMSDGIILL